MASKLRITTRKYTCLSATMRIKRIKNRIETEKEKLPFLHAFCLLKSPENCEGHFVIVKKEKRNKIGRQTHNFKLPFKCLLIFCLSLSNFNDHRKPVKSFGICPHQSLEF